MLAACARAFLLTRARQWIAGSQHADLLRTIGVRCHRPGNGVRVVGPRCERRVQPGHDRAASAIVAKFIAALAQGADERPLMGDPVDT